MRRVGANFAYAYSSSWTRSRSQEVNPLGCNGFDQLSLDRYAHGEGIYLAGIHLQTSPFELESICLDLNK